MEQKSFIKKIISNPIIQTLAVYVSGGWILIELLEYFIAHFNLNEQFRNIFLIALLCGLPVALIIAWLVSRDKEHISDRKSTEDVIPRGIFGRFIRKPFISIPGLVIVLLLIVLGIRHLNYTAKLKWAKNEALAEIESLLDNENYPAAFTLVQKAKKYISEDPDFKVLAYDATSTLTILSDPPGAEVFIRMYKDTSGVWESWGKTPIDTLEVPNYSILQMRFEKSGYENILAVVSTEFDTVSRKLFPKDSIPSGMVYVEGYSYSWPSYSFQENLGFFMDQFEVTNKQYKEFIIKGGYKDPEYWKYEFIKNGQTLTWEEAMALFSDKVGQPGPATWEASDYPEGKDHYPVTGVSWHEAAAYAAFSGKSLPTVWHWSSGAGSFIDPFTRNNYNSNIIPRSNFYGTGPEPVGKFQGANMFGAFDMAGNVREWCFNETQDGRIVCGGAWDDADYMYNSLSQLPPFDRSGKNGFRCVQYLDREKIHKEAFEPFEYRETPDYSKFEPVSDDIFNVFKNQFLYDKTALNATTDAMDDSHEDWIMETASFDAAYGEERVTAYLYLPKNTSPPYQTIIYFPGIGAVYTEKELGNSNWTIWFIDYFMKSGRAVVLPVYKGTSFRNDGLTGSMSNVNQSHQFTEWLIAWTKDFSRSIDYLETRPDIDTSKIGFLGWSWGGEIGGVIPAIERRVKVNLLVLGGFTGTAFPEADPVNYVPRIKIPVLMLNGRYDIWRPYETNLIPFYDLLGTPEKDKKLILFETDHYIPKSDMIRENLAWLDKYFGPVN